VRDDNEEVVCAACGARLEVLPALRETRVRHVGEALDAVRATLDPAAVERALGRLRERKMAQSEVLAEPLASARARRGLLALGIVGSIVGGVMALSGLGGYGAVVCLIGLFTVLGALGMRGGMGGSAMESQQRQREREALRAQQALAREISRRERVLAEAAVSRGSQSGGRSRSGCRRHRDSRPRSGRGAAQQCVSTTTAPARRCPRDAHHPG
jgi:hypothetical protein